MNCARLIRKIDQKDSSHIASMLEENGETHPFSSLLQIELLADPFYL